MSCSGWQSCDLAPINSSPTPGLWKWVGGLMLQGHVFIVANQETGQCVGEPSGTSWLQRPSSAAWERWWSRSNKLLFRPWRRWVWAPADHSDADCYLPIHWGHINSGELWEEEEKEGEQQRPRERTEGGWRVHRVVVFVRGEWIKSFSLTVGWGL